MAGLVAKEPVKGVVDGAVVFFAPGQPVPAEIDTDGSLAALGVVELVGPASTGRQKPSPE